MAMMAGSGAIPAVALSKVAWVMPWARASVLIPARKASNLALPELGGAGGTGAGAGTTGGGGGAGLGAVPAQAASARAPARAKRRKQAGVRSSMPMDTLGCGIFGRKPAFFARFSGVAGGGALLSFPPPRE